MYAVCWRWELTPSELLAGFSYVPSSKTAHLVLDETPFLCPKLPLEGTEFTYQLALSANSKALDIQALRDHHPELPVSKDPRSGVLVFHGDRVVASLIVPGKAGGYHFVVHPEYRSQRLAFRMLVEWCGQTKRPRALRHQPLTPTSVRALLAAHREVVERALLVGKPVPDHVVQAIRSGKQAASILKGLETLG
jgi:GNAT superfamily N-acetyltransferase